MQAYLMFRDRDLPRRTSGVLFEQDIRDDLELDPILEAMAGKDKSVAAACSAALLSPLTDPKEIAYRQSALRDALAHPDDVRDLYRLCADVEEKRARSWYRLSPDYLPGTLANAIALLNMYLSVLKQLRKKAEDCRSRFSSEAFSNLFAMLIRELDDEYFEEIRQVLDELERRDGTLISARLGSFLQGVDYTLRTKESGMFRSWFGAKGYTVGGRDELGDTDLAKRKERALNEVTNALAQSAEHVISFFDMLRYELAFYVGCINLDRKLESYGMECCVPEASENVRGWDGLFDVSLCLTKRMKVVGESLSPSGATSLYIVTGANQGGKSTFLRSMGQAQLMAQCGMPVGAKAFTFPVREAVYTHFKREEDASIRSGKLDEELQRLDAIVSRMKKNSLVMFNESFAATNEREGSEISGQITRALTESGMEVFSVTHLYTFASSFVGKEGVRFLRAERLSSGERTFRVHEGEPLRTAFGEDLYNRIFPE